MNHRKELECMCSFATTAWDAEADYELLRCLWTAFCIHQDVDIDTLEYDTGLHLLYTFACDNCGVRFGRVSRRCPYCGAHMDTSDRESR